MMTNQSSGVPTAAQEVTSQLFQQLPHTSATSKCEQLDNNKDPPSSLQISLKTCDQRTKPNGSLQRSTGTPIQSSQTQHSEPLSQELI